MQADKLPGSDIDLMRDVYMTSTQRAAYERLLAIAEGAEAMRLAVLAWWAKHEYDCVAFDDDERNVYDEPPAFVEIAQAMAGAVAGEGS